MVTSAWNFQRDLLMSDPLHFLLFEILQKDKKNNLKCILKFSNKKQSAACKTKRIVFTMEDASMAKQRRALVKMRKKNKKKINNFTKTENKEVVEKN